MYNIPGLLGFFPLYTSSLHNLFHTELQGCVSVCRSLLFVRSWRQAAFQAPVLLQRCIRPLWWRPTNRCLNKELLMESSSCVVFAGTLMPHPRGFIGLCADRWIVCPPWRQPSVFGTAKAFKVCRKNAAVGCGEVYKNPGGSWKTVYILKFERWYILAIQNYLRWSRSESKKYWRIESTTRRFVTIHSTWVKKSCDAPVAPRFFPSVCEWLCAVSIGLGSLLCNLRGRLVFVHFKRCIVKVRRESKSKSNAVSARIFVIQGSLWLK